MTGLRAVLRLNDRRAPPLAENVSRRRSAPARQWTLWTPIVLVAMAGLAYRGFSVTLEPSGCFLLLAAIQSYFVVWCMIVGAVPVGFRWFHSETDPYGFSLAAVVFTLLAFALGFAAVLTGPL